MLGRKDLTVIIRSSGERTVPVLRNLLGKQLAEEQLFEVNEVPNSRALKKAFKIASRQNRPWLLLIDGDILPFRQIIDRTLQIADGLDERVYCIQCNNVDKMMRLYRPSGIHMYRTALIDKALKLIPEENTMMRPESTTMGSMEEQGYPTLFAEEVLALHDFEQYYKDLYRKGYFCTHKFTDKIPYLKKIWGRLAEENNDYKVLLEGLKKGESYEGLVVSNVEQFNKMNIPRILSENGIAEKDKLNEDDIDFEWIEQIYQKFNIPREHYNAVISSKSDPEKITKPPLKRRFLQLKGKIGVMKLGPWIIGNFFEKFGTLLKSE
jgi:hypothetical protein